VQPHKHQSSSILTANPDTHTYESRSNRKKYEATATGHQKPRQHLIKRSPVRLFHWVSSISKQRLQKKYASGLPDKLSLAGMTSYSPQGSLWEGRSQPSQMTVSNSPKPFPQLMQFKFTIGSSDSKTSFGVDISARST
jgi:hypothetical protein